MAESKGATRVPIRVNKLIIELENVFLSIQRHCAIHVHGQMRHRLIGEKGRFSSHFPESLDAHRPIESLKKEQDASVHRFFHFRRSAQKAFVT